MFRIRVPNDPVERALTAATLAGALATGLFYAVSALYFTRVIGLSAATVGVGLTIGGAVGVVASYVGGLLSDRWGADRMLLGTTALHGLGLLAYVFADGTIGFVLAACWALGTRSMQGTARSALQARWFVGAERVAVRARLRVVVNVGIGLGTCLAAAALVADTATAYRVTMIAVGLTALLASVPLWRLRTRVSDLASRATPPRDADSGLPIRGRSPLRDRTYLAVVAMNAVMATQFGLLTVGVPLWIAGHTEAPPVMISLLLVTNTVLVALFQVPAARGTHDVGVAGRTVRRGGVLIAVACLLYAATAGASVVGAVVVLIVAILFASAAEIFSEAGGWGLAFELADPVSAGSYQGVSQTGYALAHMAAPALVTATAIEHGAMGWAVLAALFVAAGAGAHAVAQRAVRNRRVDVVRSEPSAAPTA